jgi:O-antigen ligase/polysaccharide polymerase Wzy-like membrane protein
MAPLMADERALAPRRSSAVTLLSVMVLTLFIFPSNAVIHAVGGAGYVAALVSYVILLLYVGVTLVGQHHPTQYHSPVRTALAVLWIVSLVSYVLMDRALLNETQQVGAERWLLQMAGITGIILVASECIHTYEDVRRVLRALCWGDAICGVVAGMQWWLNKDITPYLRELPGFTINAAAGIYGIESRGGVARVAGTGIDPIEMGVVAGMILPIAIYLAMYDKHRSIVARWLPVPLIAICIPTSVSRSAILAALIGLATLVISMKPRTRVSLLAGMPIALGFIFVTSHGLLGTLNQYFFAGSSDNSIAHRLNNYPYVESLVRQAPWFGQGGGTYYFTTQVNILDNQYLTTAVELGLVGVCALAFFLLWPAAAALSARKLALTDSTRDLCAALAGAELAAVLCSGTFDSLSFPLFVNTQALIVGLIGAVWLIAHADARALKKAQSVPMNDPKMTWHVNGVSVWRAPALNGADKPDGGN